jgi:heat shock protein HslJ
MRLTLFGYGAIALTIIGNGCTPREEPSDQEPANDRRVQPATSAPAPTWSELAGATYSGIPDLPANVTLVNGRWEGPPIVPGGTSALALTLAPSFRLSGDLDADGGDEAVVLLAQSAGGSGENLYLAVMGRQAAGLRQVAAAPIGNRVQIRRARTDQNRVILDVVQLGESDAMCCPGELAERIWALESAGLRELASATPRGRLSRSVLEGTEWVLRSWTWDEPAPGTPEITFTVAGDRIAGRSGCNRFTGILSEGNAPGDLKVGPLAGTRMACPEPAMSIEQRFQSQMAGVRKFGFAGARLALTYEREGAVGTMIFEGRPAAAPEP